MKLGNLRKTLNGLTTENTNLWISNIGLVACVIVLTILVMSKEVAVAVIPPTLNSEVELTRERASSGYHQAWGLFMAELVGNVTPTNADFVVQSLEGLMSSEIYNALRGFLAADIEDIKNKRVTTSFQPVNVSWEPQTNKVFVFGDYVVEAPGAESVVSKRTYEFEFEIANWQLLAKWFDSYEGVPRTLQYLERTKKIQRETQS